MDESLRLQLKHRGQPLEINSVSSNGIVLFGETSAWPRPTSLRLVPVSPLALKLVKDQGGASSKTIRCMKAADGELLVKGVKSNSFPSGFWDVRLTVNGLRIRGERRVRVPKSQQGDISWTASERDRRTIAVKDPDPLIRRILEESHLDGRPVAQWVDESRPRVRRRACLMNVLAVCRELNLIEKIREIVFAEVDRLYAVVEDDFESLLDDRFGADGPPTASVHKRLLDIIADEDQMNYELLSFRQRRSPSLQVVIAKRTDDARTTHIEMDIDRGNIRDPVGFFIHMGEVFFPGRTDHLSLLSKLRETPAAPFLMYEVQEKASS